MGTDGFLVPAGPDQLLALPWVNVNLVRVKFSQDVIVDPTDLSIRGVNVGSYTTPGFNYLATPRTATWQVAPAFGRDKLLLDLNGTTAGGVMDAAGNALDGEWLNGGATENYPSGDGSPGGDFEFRLNVLPGDVNGSGTVDGSDFAQLASHFGRTPRHHTQGNLNGDLIVDGSDFAVLATNFGRSLPTGNPAVVAGAALAAPPVRPPPVNPIRRVAPARAPGAVLPRITSPLLRPQSRPTS
jgi:hypothetical protein